MRYLHTMVRVADLDRSLDFYCGKLGLVEVRRIDNPAGRFTLVVLSAPADRDHAAETKAPLIEPGAVAKMMELGMDPDKIIDKGLKLQSEARQTAALQQKEGEADRKLQEEDMKAQQKQEAEAAKERTKTMRDSIAGERDYRKAQEEHARDLQQYQEDLRQYEQAKAMHARQSSRGSGAGGAAPKPFSQTPPAKPIPPSPGLFADKIPTPRSPDEVQALEPGTRFIAPDGSIRVR